MGWYSGIVITNQEVSEISDKLENLRLKELASNEGYTLLAFEGRYSPVLDGEEHYTMAIDARNINLIVCGNESLAELFAAHFFVSVGASIKESDFETLSEHLKEKMEYAEVDADADRRALRVDVDMRDVDAIDTMEDLQEMSDDLETLGIAHRVTAFVSGEPIILGYLEDDGPWIGPSAYIQANWTTDDGEHELIISDTESSLDGMMIEELSGSPSW